MEIIYIKKEQESINDKQEITGSNISQHIKHDLLILQHI